MKKILLLMLLIFVLLQINAAAQTNNVTYLVGSTEDVAMNPVYSLDGKMIAFTKSGFMGLYVYNLETENIIQLSNEPSAGYGFKWSSDSKSILSRVARYDGPRRYNSLKIFDVQSGSFDQLSDETTNMPYLPEWIPGNDRVILPQKDGAKIFNTGKDPFFIENESTITVYSRHDKIVVNNFTTSVETILEPIKNQNYLNVLLSPDKSKITFEVYGGNLFVMNIDGSEITDLGTGYNAVWSPDSKSLIFMITEDDGHKFTASDIYKIDINGMNKINLTNTAEEIELNPSISPDGRKLAYESYLDGAIYLMNLD